MIVTAVQKDEGAVFSLLCHAKTVDLRAVELAAVDCIERADGAVIKLAHFRHEIEGCVKFLGVAVMGDRIVFIYLVEFISQKLTELSFSGICYAAAEGAVFVPDVARKLKPPARVEGIILVAEQLVKECGGDRAFAEMLSYLICKRRLI